MQQVSGFINQKVPPAGPVREQLRTKGQFWTPAIIAEAMVAYVLKNGSDHLFDPAVGSGVFFQAAKTVARDFNYPIGLFGTEIDPLALEQASLLGLTQDDLTGVKIQDFLKTPSDKLFSAIVANPPYIRHHRLNPEIKLALRNYSASITGQSLDGRAGLHVYFLLKALQLLKPDGRLAFIMPADTVEGIFAPALWRWISQQYCIDAVITFASSASPFPQIDTNPLIFLIRNAPSDSELWWAKCLTADYRELKNWIIADFGPKDTPNFSAAKRNLQEGVTTGLSRPPLIRQEKSNFVLGDFARVMRGVATGANDFFFLTRQQVEALNIPQEFLTSAIGRTRDVTGSEITTQTLEELERLNRPTRLLSLDGRPIEAFPPSLQAYLKNAELLGIPAKSLISTRKPWYKMESRATPPFLFAYLGRRNARFIRNLAGIIPLTGFLCVYPLQNEPAYIEKLWQILSHPATVANLALVGKSYGSGAIKVEPRALERLTLPDWLIEETKLNSVSVHRV